MDGTEPVDIGAMNPPALHGTPSSAQAEAMAVMRNIIETGDTAAFERIMTGGLLNELRTHPKSPVTKPASFDPSLSGKGDLLQDFAATVGTDPETVEKFAKKMETRLRINALAADQFSPADGKYSPAPPAANILNSLMGNYGRTGTHDKPGSDENGVTIERTAGSIVATLDPLPRQASSAQKKEPPGVSFSACIDGTELSGQITGKFNAQNVNPAMVSMAAQTALENLGKSPADRFSLADWDRMKRQMETSLGTPIEGIRGIALQGPRCN